MSGLNKLTYSVSCSYIVSNFIYARKASYIYARKIYATVEINL